ncbi:ATP-binding domain-containing protein [Kitasatospora sp. NPDC086801]|uniref:ATP-binding domain-containing protein n=1 Tax=Kitasatospora sp. NPDC086801 TaxID=3364066 RepID=UPI0037F3869D
MLYERLDESRERISAQVNALLQNHSGTHQGRIERDAAHTMYSGKLARLIAAENGLCFGRLDLREDDEPRYIGRLGVFSDAEDHKPLLIDWRAPSARPFYLATVISPHGVRRRRHIRTSHRKVTEVHDEVLDLDAADSFRNEGVTGEAALLAALNASRTGRMTDIVETIQTEQDRIIRSSHNGVLVVQGGPGTGKTAVALHRAAFLLYTHREQLARRVVLIIGPNPTFLRYIGQVLPSLGESGVLLSTVGELYPGVTADLVESPDTSEIKGRITMADVIATAVRDRQWVPDDVVLVEYERETLRLDRQTCERARERARDSGLLHNQARPIVVQQISEVLAQQYGDRIGADPYGGPNLLDDAQIEDIRQELLQDPAVHAALDMLWPVLAPQQLLTDLFASPERIASAAPQLTAEERRLLLREPHRGWASSDVPLLDDATELLGEDEQEARALAERERRARIAYAKGVLDVAHGSRSTDLEDDQEAEILSAFDLVDAEYLAERHEEPDYRTAAERAAADRTWAFGHVIVDEAQELSEMAWRLLMRRCPVRSMTIVGDVAQTGEPAGTNSWDQVLGPYSDKRWRLEQLSVNYRMPAEIMAVAADVLAEIDPALQVPQSVRETGVEPWRQEVPQTELAERLTEMVARETAELGDRRLAVIVPGARVRELGKAVTRSVPSATIGEDPQPEARVAVLDTRQAKGLEFDVVLVVEPGEIVTESRRGLNDLYVALTRATQRLGVVHTGELPTALSRLRPVNAPRQTPVDP